MLFFEPKNFIFAVCLAEAAIFVVRPINFGANQVCVCRVKIYFDIWFKIKIEIFLKFVLTWQNDAIFGIYFAAHDPGLASTGVFLRIFSQDLVCNQIFT